MAYVDMVNSHVERLLQDEFELCRVERDADGDYGFRQGSAGYYVRVVDGDPVVVRVFAIAVVGVRRSAKLLAELNSVNAHLVFGRVFWVADMVMFEHTLLASSIDRETLARAARSVATVSDEVGPLLAAVFGGVTAFTGRSGTAQWTADPADERLPTWLTPWLMPWRGRGPACGSGCPGPAAVAW